MQSRLFFIIIVSISLVFLTSFVEKSEEKSIDNVKTSGSLAFSVTTSTTGQYFAPKHVVAIWIENSSGEFIKTLKVRANYQINYLYQWKNSSSSNTVDAITGATLTSHQTHSLTWDCTDVSGELVPDGDYTVRVEFSEKNGQGPYTSYTFTKGNTEVSLSPSDLTNFKNVSIVYTPESTGITEKEKELPIRVFPNPAKEFIVISADEIIENISIFNQEGSLILIQNEKVLSKECKINFDSNLPSGNYFYKIQTTNNLIRGRFLILD